MSSFLKRLKSKRIVPTTAEDEKMEQVEAQQEAAEKVAAETKTIVDQLKVDIFQTQNAILVYAQIAGAGTEDYSVMIEGDSDIVVIKGTRNRPNSNSFDLNADEGHEQVLAECAWEDFYRQIILPTEIDPAQAQAKSSNGVLMLHLPLQRSENKGVRLDVTSM